MNKIKQQVSRAKRRIMAGNFFRILSWSLFAGLLLALIGMLVPKIWYLNFLQNQDHFDAWNYSWILGGLFVALLTSAILTWRQLQSTVFVAAEVDKRFGLKERLSSALSLRPQDLETDAGQALLQDAVRRAETIDVRDQFPFQFSPKSLLPLIPLALMIALLFVPNATEKTVTAGEPEKIDRQQVEMAIKEFKKKAEEKRQQLTAKGLEDANAKLKSLEKKFDELLDDKNTDKKDALVKLNDIKQQIQDRQQELGNSNELKENLNRLKDINSGPAKDLVNALAQGDMSEAKKAIKELADKLREGKLSDIEKKKLAADLEAMAKELQNLAEKHQEQKKALEEQLKKALDKGDLEKAAELQQKLEQNQQQEKQMGKMQEMAENLQKCAKCMNPGNQGQPKPGQQQPAPNGEQKAQAIKQAAQSLEDLAQQIEQMQLDLEEMEALEDMEKLAGDCKQCINGQAANGQQDGPPKWQDWAQGGGNGGGKRDLEKEDTGGFKARVKGKVGQGETVITGNADGNNITGRTLSEARDLVEAAMSQDADPLENQKLPKAQREHAQQYFEALRKND